MGAIVTLDTKNTTLTLNGRIIEDVPQGDTFTISFPNEISSQTQGVSGGVVAKDRSDKDTATLTVRVLRGSGDDSFFTNIINQQNLAVIDGSMKTNFVRDGVAGTDTYTLSTGTMQNREDHVINNSDGEEVSQYVILFGSAIRQL